MIDCKDCNPTVFDIIATDAVVTDKGHSLKTELSLIDGSLEGLINDVDSLKNGGSNSEADLGDLTSTNSPLSVVSPNPISVVVTPGPVSTNISYDLRSALINSTQDIINVEAFGKVNGVNGRIHTGNSSVGSFTAAPENFPISLSFNVTSLTADGQKIITLTTLVYNVTSTTDYLPTVTDLSTTSLVSQKDVNEYFDLQINSLKNMISNQSKTIDALLLEIDKLKA